MAHGGPHRCHIILGGEDAIKAFGNNTDILKCFDPTGAILKNGRLGDIFGAPVLCEPLAERRNFLKPYGMYVQADDGSALTAIRIA
jgi:hypothetical protein